MCLWEVEQALQLKQALEARLLYRLIQLAVLSETLVTSDQAIAYHSASSMTKEGRLKKEAWHRLHGHFRCQGFARTTSGVCSMGTSAGSIVSC